VSSIIPSLDLTTCQVEIENPGKAYGGVIESVSNKFEALLKALLREKIRFKFLLHIIKRIKGGPS
jgi:hypothetical protein